MSVWDMNVQRILDLVERNLRKELTLEDVSRRLGYFKWYCTRQFRKVVGMNLRSYLRMRRMSEAAIMLRDGAFGILDIAVEFGFSSQEAFTRSFKAAWGINPAAWRRNHLPLCLVLKHHALDSNEGGFMKGKVEKVTVSIQHVPARKFIGIKAYGAEDYMDFWEKIGAAGWDCSKVEGILASITGNAQLGGWFVDADGKGYLYGVEVPADYSGSVPDGMECFPVPESDYLVFHHPPFDFNSMEDAVWHAIAAEVEKHKEAPVGYAWNQSIPMWQRHDPEKMGEAWCKAINKVK